MGPEKKGCKITNGDQYGDVKWSAIKLSPRLLRAEDAAMFVGGESILRDLEDAGWVKPVKRGNRLTLWDAKLLDQACDRLQTQSLPGWDINERDRKAAADIRAMSEFPEDRELSFRELRALISTPYERHSKIPTRADIKMRHLADLG